jgi:DNA-binding transcriptional ArsR family regulator
MTTITTSGPSLDELGQALAEPARLRILFELLGGIPLPAGALAARVGLAPSTVSGHLARLSEAGLITIQQQGRSRLARLDRPDVAEALEALSRLAQQKPVSSLTADKRRTAMREARTCYDHLAGRLGVAVADLFLARGWLIERDGLWVLPHVGVQPCSDTLGIPVTVPEGTSRPAARPCPDWTERRPHVAGLLGAALLTAMLDAGWVSRRTSDRALRINADGSAALIRLGIAEPSPERHPDRAWSSASG